MQTDPKDSEKSHAVPGEALARADHAWLSRLISRCERPENFTNALQRKPDDIKVVIQFAQA